MGIMSGVVVYIVIWVVMLFMVLPFGVKVIENPEVGHASSAPENPRIGMKFLVTSLISIPLWFVAYYLITSDWFSFKPEI